MTTKKSVLSAIEQKAISILNRFDPEHLASTKNPSISLYLHPPTHTAKGILAALVHNHGDLVPKPTEYPTALRAHTSEALEPSLLSTATPLARVKAEIGAGTGAQGGHRVSTGVEGERRAGVKRKAAVAEINHSGVALALPPNPKRKAFQHYYPAAAASATTLIYAKSIPGMGIPTAAAVGNKVFPTATPVARPTARVPTRGRRAPFRCPQCQAEFQNSEQLLMHHRSRMCGPQYGVQRVNQTVPARLYSGS